MLELSLGNLVAWAIQVAALGIAGVLLPALFRVTSPGARLVYLRVVLVACLVLPLVQPWVPPSIGPSVSTAVSSAADDEALALALRPDALAAAPAPARSPAWLFVASWLVRWRIEALLGAVYAAGLVLRLAWLGLGLLSLSRLRRTSAAVEPRPASLDDAALLVGVDADFRVSSRVVRPVTFGLRRPLVLVPPDFLSFRPDQQTAVAAHELLHVARRDWVRTLGDELVLSVFWFHPALWWLIEQIHLSVEQVVDREVVERVGARKPYLEALLRLAAAGPTPMLQPASLFLKHGHLAQRVALLVREASMSRVRLAASFVIVLAVLAAGGWYVVQAFPLRAVLAPVVLPPVPSPARFVKAPPPPPPTPVPPAPARAAGIQASSGQQTKPTVDPKAQQAKPGAVLPPPPLPPPPPPGERSSGYVAPPPFDRMAWEKAVQGLVSRVAADPANPTLQYTLAAYYWERVYRDAALPAAEGRAYLKKGLEAIDTAIELKPDYMEALIYKNLLLRQQATAEPDPAKQRALIAEADRLRDEAVRIRDARNPWAAIPPNAVRVGANIKPPTKVKDVKPVYPAVASNAGVQGVVIIEAVISPVGSVQASRVLRSIPLLDQAALDAVNQWEFAPTLLNGEAVPIVMTVTANFTLADGPRKSGGSGAIAGGVAGGVPGGVAGGVTGGLAGGVMITGVLGGQEGVPPPLPPDTVRVGGGIRPPTKVTDVKAVYPLEAQQARIQGVVIIEAMIGKDGKVTSAKVVRSIPELDQAALDAVKQWAFTPTVIEGAPVNVVMTVTVNFTLQ